MSISSLFVAHTEFCIIYICFLQPLLGLSIAHIELILHVYAYMPFTDLKSASKTYVLDFQCMSSFKFLGHTNFYINGVTMIQLLNYPIYFKNSLPTEI